MNTKREDFLINKLFLPFAAFVIFFGIVIDISKDNSAIETQFKNDYVVYEKLQSHSPYLLNDDIRIEIQSIEQLNTTKKKSKEVKGKIFLSNKDNSTLTKNKFIAMNFLCTNPESVNLLVNDYDLSFFVITKVKNKYTTLNKIFDTLNMKLIDCKNNNNFSSNSK